ncbi:MAG: type I-C CRISPR-associated protein Cas7/Csd2 [Planctomycetaceae bacterium]|nr:type I-C CRISPR-associated protein Cas7/Csd2 [Planctomycetaceae bacterium]
MTESTNESIKNRHDFILIFDVKDGNPNGDPDAGNLPRFDPETGHGLVTDVCIKRKIRNFVGNIIGNDPDSPYSDKNRYDIFVREKAVLNDLIDQAHEQPEVKKAAKDKKTGEARQWMCTKYFDIRTFGAVMSTGQNAGQVRGPVQLTFGRSVDPIVTLEHTITRVAVTKPNDFDVKGNLKETQMGRKNTVPYGIYVSYGFISPHLAAQTGFSDKDLELFWDALVNMFEHDHSAARGQMNTCKLVIFKHASALGNAPSKSLFDRVKVAKNKKDEPARDSSDYTFTIDGKKLRSEIVRVDVDVVNDREIQINNESEIIEKP